MNEKAFNTSQVENDLEMVRHWVRQGPKTAAFVLVIPGCAIAGYGFGLLVAHSLPCALIGFGAGLLVWGLIVSLSQ